MSDVTVRVGGYLVNLRVGAIVCREDKVLVCRQRDKIWWYLPGGRIKANESSLAALERELSEELGEGFRVLRPAICSENFFELEGEEFHEVCLYYEVAWHGGEIRDSGKEDGEVFEWVSRSGVSDLDLRPTFMRRHIADPAANAEFIIHRDDGGAGGAPAE